jgi:hypothetical protein
MPGGGSDCRDARHTANQATASFLGVEARSAAHNEHIVTLDHYINGRLVGPKSAVGQTENNSGASKCFPLCPRTRTLLDAVGMSQTCQ